MPASWWRNPILRQVILGTHDKSSPLSLLRGNEYILRAIIQQLIDAWSSHILSDARGYVRLEWIRRVFHRDDGEYENRPRTVVFPSPLTYEVDGEMVSMPYHVNMMPFIMDDASSLPEECQRYLPIINFCLRCLQYRENGLVGYLTIHEGWVEPNTSQRRGGLHVEISGGGFHEQEEECHWGGGIAVENNLWGGIFMGSTVGNSCGVWDVCIEDSQSVMGVLGDMEHYRTILDEHVHKYIVLEPNEIIWITDETPHESLPLTTRQYRQYFRLVTSKVTHWFADHSTPNPLGIQPACIIVKGDKFKASNLNLSIDESMIPLKIVEEN